MCINGTIRQVSVFFFLHFPCLKNYVIVKSVLGALWIGSLVFQFKELGLWLNFDIWNFNHIWKCMNMYSEKECGMDITIVIVFKKKLWYRETQQNHGKVKTWSRIFVLFFKKLNLFWYRVQPSIPSHMYYSNWVIQK